MDIMKPIPDDHPMYAPRKARQATGSGLLAHIEAAEQQAHRDGFHVTAHALNRAKNACGWEIAGDVEQAGKAARSV